MGATITGAAAGTATKTATTDPAVATVMGGADATKMMEKEVRRQSQGQGNVLNIQSSSVLLLFLTILS